jgi:two-component system sensor histidine kinase AlgZ
MDDSTPRRSRLSPFWMLQLGGWGLVWATMFAAAAQEIPLWWAAINKGILALLGLLVSLALWRIYVRLEARGASFKTMVAAALLCAYPASVVWSAAYQLAIEVCRALYRDRAFALDSWQQLFIGAVYHAFVLLAWSLFYLFLRHQRELQEERERALRAEALAERAQLQALRYQLNPHFLFNTLNAISSLVAQRRDADADRMIARLSEFLRMTLDGSAAERVPLADELEFAERYLEIEQVRFAGRLSATLDAAPETLSALVPALVLQPLVENAIRHGVAPREEGGRVSVTARRAGERLRLEVRNDAPAGAVPRAEGVGLTNTRARLAHLYGDGHRVEVRGAEDGAFAVALELPFETTPELARAATGRAGA